MDKEHATTAVGGVGRKSSGTVKAYRRTSLLTDGTPAYPHPKISDADLYRHCSGELKPQERMRHVVGWTLERSRKDMKNSGGELSAKYRGPLMAALESTLLDLNQGSLKIDWRQRQKGKEKAINSSSSDERARRKKSIPHPRNEANLKAQLQLVKTVRDMQQEEKTWEEVQAELKAFEEETMRLKEKQDSLGVEDETMNALDVTSMEGDEEWSPEDAIRMEKARRALVLEQEWATGSSQGEKVIRKASEYISVGQEQQQQAATLGTELDLRWRDVEFKSDLLRAKAHSFAQLSALSQRYIRAISARGAKALQEMTQGNSQDNESSSQNQVNLDRILSSIRTIEDERGEDDDENDDHEQQRDQGGIGDVSDGDILRALAGFG